MRRSLIHRYVSLTAILPVLLLVGCQAVTDQTNQTLDGMRSNTQGNRQLKAKTVDKSINPTPTPTDQHTKGMFIAYTSSRAAERRDDVYQQSLITWQNEIVQAAATVSDANAQAGYNIIITALDTQTDQQIANSLYHIITTPLELEVILYKVTPAQQTALWNRLPASRVNNILNYVQPQHQTSVAVYLGDLNQIGLVAPSTVPWNRIPTEYLAP
jgi:hypothetical protein